MYIKLNQDSIIHETYSFKVPDSIHIKDKRQQEIIRENFKIKYDNGKLEVIEKEAPQVEEEPKLTDKQRIAQLEQAILELSMRGL